MTLLPIVDAIRANVPVPDDTVRDDSGAAPIPYEPGCLYVWGRTDVRTQTGDGSMERSDFNVRLAITVPAFETAEMPRDRSVTEALDRALGAISAWVIGHRATSPSGDLWGLLRIASIDHEAIRGPEYRGALVDLTGWRFIETEA